MGTEQGFGHVDWSASTASLYASCPRRFYYRNSASHSELETANPSSGTTVQPPGAKVGIVVHDCIEEQVSRWRENMPLSLQTAQTSATQQLQAYLDDNKRVIETRYFNGDGAFDPTEFARSLIRTAHNHLECFFQVIWPQLDDHQYILHEQTKSFEVGGQTVWVKPDLCTRSQGGEFVVTDWKTSPPDRFSDPDLQVLTYALWAYQCYEPDLERILVQLVHTKQGEFDRTQPDTDDIATIRDRIISDYETWQETTSVADFTPKPEKGKCEGCPYLDQCNAGKSVVGDPS